MASGNSTVTIDTGEMLYIDSTGIGHKVTNLETFTLYVYDATNCRYKIPVGQTMVTDDGYTLTFRPEVNGMGNQGHELHFFTDAAQGTTMLHNKGGEIPIECSVNGVIQRWKVAQIAPSDADFASAGTIKMILEDQFGNRITTGTSITVGVVGG